MNKDRRAWFRHAAGSYRSPSVGRCRCVVCGDSRYQPAGAASAVLTSSFGDHDWLLAPDSNIVCAGCLGLLGGRPGDVPAPFRTLNVLVTASTITVLDTPDQIVSTLANPPDEPFGLVWSIKRRRHAWLRAERCTAGRIVVGTDNGPVVFRPSDRPVLEAITSLLSAFGREEIRLGQYAAHTVTSAGHDWWWQHEQVIAVRRPSDLVDLLCRLVPRPDPRVPEPPGDTMLEPDDADAVSLLTDLALASDLRSRDGLVFWKGAFLHRLRRFARLPMPDMISRLIAELDVPSHAEMPVVNEAIYAWSSERVSACSTAIRERNALLVSLTFQAAKRRKETR